MVAHHLLTLQHKLRSILVRPVEILLKQSVHCSQPFGVLSQENARDTGERQVETPVEVVQRLVQLHSWEGTAEEGIARGLIEHG